MKGPRKKNKPADAKPAVDQPVMDEAPIADQAQADSIEDFIELKRLQNRILEKLINQISKAENSENTNKKNK